MKASYLTAWKAHSKCGCLPSLRAQAHGSMRYRPQNHKYGSDDLQRHEVSQPLDPGAKVCGVEEVDAQPHVDARYPGDRRGHVDEPCDFSGYR